jgi:hypothetical protein
MLEIDAERATPETNEPSTNALREFAESPVLEQDTSPERAVGEGEVCPNAPEGAPMFSGADSGRLSSPVSKSSDPITWNSRDHVPSGTLACDHRRAVPEFCVPIS